MSGRKSKGPGVVALGPFESKGAAMSGPSSTYDTPIVGKRYDLDDLVTLEEASEQLGFAASSLKDIRLRHLDTFPEPVRVFGRVQVFDMRAIREWNDRRLS